MSDIVANASRVLLNPFLLVVLVVGVLAPATGLAGRVAIVIEDLHYRLTAVASLADPIRRAFHSNRPTENGDQ